MKRYLHIIPVFFLAINAAYAQNTADNPVPQMDDAVTELAALLHAKLVEVKAERVAIGQFIYRGSLPRFATYWVNQLTGELVNIPDKPYMILSGGAAGADRTISGEIVDVANTIRVYTNLIRADNRAIDAVFNSDFERSVSLVATLASGDSRNDGSASGIPIDEWEPDSWENPVSYEPGISENGLLINRTLHGNNDEDFFLIIPQADGRLTMETTGDIDTYMEFYDADTRELLAEDDDSGSSNNARIRYNVRAGKSYIAKVRGYSRSTTGHYAFRASLTIRTGGSTWNNPVMYEPGAGEFAPVVNCTLNNDYDEDYFLIIPMADGRLTVETTGRLDTLMELYDADTEVLLDKDDDSGENYNARIHYNVQAGKRYIAVVSGYGGESGDYGFRARLTVE